MNILVIGQFYTEAFGLHIKETLEDMGHKVIPFNPGIKFNFSSLLGRKLNNIRYTFHSEVMSKIPSYQKRKTKDLFKKYASTNIELTIVLHDYLFPEQVQKLKKITKAPVAIWFPDPLSNIKRAMFMIADYDYLFFADRYISNVLKKDLGLNTFYLPQACYPKYHRYVEMNEKEYEKYACDIANVGNMYSPRIALYRQLAEYNIKMWGSPTAIWANIPEINPMMQNEVVHHDEKCKAFRAAKIILNNIHPAVVDGINRRAFEIPACGGLEITKNANAVKEMFLDDEEIVTYESIPELKEKINFYISNPEKRQEIIEKGMKRAHNDHTFEVRLTEMFSTIFSS